MDPKILLLTMKQYSSCEFYLKLVEKKALAPNCYLQMAKGARGTFFGITYNGVEVI
jgi:hypothetical protein